MTYALEMGATRGAVEVIHATGISGTCDDPGFAISQLCLLQNVFGESIEVCNILEHTS